MAARRRSSGDGSIYYSDAYHRYVGQVTLGHTAGKIVRKKFYGPKRDDSKAARLGVEERMRPFMGRRGSGGLESLQSFATRWLETAPIRAKTKDLWAGTIRNHLGTLGGRRLVEISPVHVRDHLASLDVGARTRKLVYTTLHRVLREAVDLELIARNPAAKVAAPRVPQRQMRPLTLLEVRCLLQAAVGDRLEAFVVLALATTMGPGELEALRWHDVDLDRGTVRVVADLVESEQYGYVPTLEETKVKKRRRSITLPPIAVRALIRRRELAESPEFVFTREDGRLIRHSMLRKVWWRNLTAKARAIAAQSGIGFPERLRMYDLRHTANVLMGLAGVPIEIASARMGHSSISQTVDTYGHLQPSQHHDAARKIEELLVALSHNLRHDGSP